MKKIVSFILFVFMIINTSISFAEFTLDTKLSVQKQNAYKKQIDKVYKNFDNKLSKLSEEKQISNIKTLVKKNDKLLLNKLSEKNNFVLSYLNYLLKEKLDLLQDKIKEKEEKELLEKQEKINKEQEQKKKEFPMNLLNNQNYHIKITGEIDNIFGILIFDVIKNQDKIKVTKYYKDLDTGLINKSYDSDDYKGEFELSSYGNNVEVLNISESHWQFENIHEGFTYTNYELPLNINAKDVEGYYKHYNEYSSYNSTQKYNYTIEILSKDLEEKECNIKGILKDGIKLFYTKSSKDFYKINNFSCFTGKDKAIYNGYKLNYFEENVK